MENMQNVGTKSAFTPKKYFKKWWELRPRGTERERERERERVRSRNGSLRCRI